MSNRKSLAEEFIYSLRFDFGDFRKLALGNAENFFCLSDSHTDRARRAEIETQCFWLLGAFLKRAKKVCDERSLDASSSEASDLFYKAYCDAGDLRFMMCDLDSDKQKDQLTSIEVMNIYALRMNLNRFDPISKQLKTQKIVGRISDDLERYMKEYLSSPLRTDEIDSEMFKILAEEEPIQYIHHVAWENPAYPDLGVTAKLTAAQNYVNRINKPITGYLFRTFLEAVIPPVLIFVGAIYLNWDGIGFVALALSLMWIAYVVYVTSGFLRYRSKYRSGKIQNKHTDVLKMTLAMEDFIQTLRSEGLVSLSRIEQKIKNLEEIGAVMPETLFVFIDDLKEKGIKAI